jgi:hypothetical protein
VAEKLELEYVKIRVDLPDAEDGVGGEGLWAVKVGEDIYEEAVAYLFGGLFRGSLGLVVDFDIA